MVPSSSSVTLVLHFSMATNIASSLVTSGTVQELKQACSIHRRISHAGRASLPFVHQIPHQQFSISSPWQRQRVCVRFAGSCFPGGS